MCTPSLLSTVSSSSSLKRWGCGGARRRRRGGSGSSSCSATRRESEARGRSFWGVGVSGTHAAPFFEWRGRYCPPHATTATTKLANRRKATTTTTTPTTRVPLPRKTPNFLHSGHCSSASGGRRDCRCPRRRCRCCRRRLCTPPCPLSGRSRWLMRGCLTPTTAFLPFPFPCPPNF